MKEQQENTANTLRCGEKNARVVQQYGRLKPNVGFLGNDTHIRPNTS